MNIIDISWPINESMTSYKDSKPVTFTRHLEFATAGVRDSSVLLNTHTGTHVDAPSHFLKDGGSIDKTPLSKLIGEAVVIDLLHVFDAITPADLPESLITPGSIVLCKTNNSILPPQDAFEPNFIYINADAAKHLADRGVKAVGIDYLGIERNQPAHDTHQILLGAGIAVIEGLRLEHVAAGKYTLICLPLALQGLEAAPARAVLMTA